VLKLCECEPDPFCLDLVHRAAISGLQTENAARFGGFSRDRSSKRGRREMPAGLYRLRRSFRILCKLYVLSEDQGLSTLEYVGDIHECRPERIFYATTL